MRKSYIIAAVILLAAVGWIGSGMVTEDRLTGAPTAGAPDAAAPTAEAEEDALTRVRVATSIAHERVDALTASGRTAADRTLQVRAETSGQVAEVLVEKGDVVAAGDVLVRLSMDDREARLAKARANVHQREIQYEAARDLEARNFASRVRLAEAEAALEEARADLAEIMLDVDRTAIKAPFGGMLSALPVEVGDVLSPGGDVATIVDLDPLVISTDIAERHIGDIQPGAPAEADIFNGPKLDGEVTFVSPVADAATRTFTVEVEVPNPDMALREGQTAELHLPLRNVQAHELSPALLTLDAEGRIGVKTVDDADTVRFHPVDMVAARPEAIWLTGLPERVRVITVGQEFVSAGQVVEPVDAPAPTAPGPVGSGAPVAEAPGADDAAPPPEEGGPTDAAATVPAAEQSLLPLGAAQAAEAADQRK